MRRRLLIGGAITGGVLLAALLGVWLSYTRIAEWVIRDKVLPKVERRLGREVEVGSMKVERGKVVFKNVVVAGQGDGAPALLRIPEVRATYDYGASWRGDVIIDEVVINGFEAQVQRHVDGSLSIDDLLDRFVRNKGEGEENKRQSFGRLRPKQLKVSGGKASLVDKATGAKAEVGGIAGATGEGDKITLTVGHLSASAGPGPRVSLGDLIVDVNLKDPIGSAQVDVGSGELNIWPGMSLTGIVGTIKQGSDGGELIIDLTGSYGGSTETLWYANGWIKPMTRTGQLTVKADAFTLDRIAPVLHDTIVQDFDDTSIDAELLIEAERGEARFAGLLNIQGLNVHHPMLSLEPLLDVSFQVELAAALDSRARTLDLTSMNIMSQGVSYQLSGEVALAGGVEADGSPRVSPRLKAHALVPPTGCQKVLRSIPAGFIPKLQGFELKGTFEADVKLEIDWSDLQELTVLDGFVGLPDCDVVSPNEEFDTERLTNSFEHQTLVGPEEYETVVIGLESDNYAQIFDISSFFLNAVLTQEDSRFYEHEGFITREFRTALVRNLEAGRFKFGASSITMQMVKNVFLYRDKTVSRKVQELFLTWYVEQTLEKNRILEIYVNAIEYGPGVYGIVQAARLYFAKHPRELAPEEAVWLTQLLPSPRRRYFQYCRPKVGKRTRNKMGRILNNMNKRGRLSDEELEQVDVDALDFNPQKDKELCKKMPDW